MARKRRNPINVEEDVRNALKFLLMFMSLIAGVVLAQHFLDEERVSWAKHIAGVAQRVVGTPCIFGVKSEPGTANLKTVTVIAPVKHDVPPLPVTFLQQWHFSEPARSGAVCAPNLTAMFYIHDGAASISMKALQQHDAHSQIVWLGVGAVVGFLIPPVAFALRHPCHMLLDMID